MTQFFQSNHDIVFFLYGEAFFVLGIAIALQSRRHSQLPLARHLNWLSIFGIVHGIYEWGTVFIPIQQTYLAPQAVDVLRLLKLGLEVVSFFALFQFGVGLLDEDAASRFWRWVPLGLAAAWLLAVLLLQWQVGDSFDEFLDIGDAIARYLLGVPGAALAALGLWQQARQVRQMELSRIARYFRDAAMVFGAYAISSAVAPRGDFFPATLLNYDSILNTLGVPVVIFRALCGALIAYLIIRGLDIFDIETDRLLEDAAQARAVHTDRERIGRELHDGIIQSLYAAGLALEDAALTIGDDPPRARQRIGGVVDSLDRTIRDLRSYILDLRSPAPQQTWIARLEDLIRLFRSQTLINAELKIQGEARAGIDPTRCGEVLAITREALTNARKHARASRVEVRVTYHPTEVELAIADNGDGFAPGEATLAPGEHQGIRNMQERARMMGGRLEIDSQKGRGTTVHVYVPCRDEERPDDAASHPG